MSFYQPEYLFWLAVLPLLVFIYSVRVSIRKKNIKRWLGPQSTFLRSGINDKKRALKIGLRVFILALLFIALSRPQGKGELIEAYNKGLYLLLLIDVSKSMLTEDIKPNRLSLVQKQISRLVDLSSGNHIAIGIFANSVLWLSPFTHDMSAVKSYLNDLSADYLIDQGTNFANVLGASVNMFDSIKEKTVESSVKAVLIVSDGEDHSIQARQTAQLLFKQRGVRIFTLSVGTKKGGVIPIRDYKNQIKGYKKDRYGNLVMSRLKQESLKQIAKEGKGSYYHLNYRGKAIDKIRKDLEHLEQNMSDKMAYTKRREFYQLLLIAAIFLGLIELLLSNKFYKRKWFYRFTP